jgi:hypothetical protein
MRVLTPCPLSIGMERGFTPEPSPDVGELPVVVVAGHAEGEADEGGDDAG